MDLFLYSMYFAYYFFFIYYFKVFLSHKVPGLTHYQGFGLSSLSQLGQI